MLDFSGSTTVYLACGVTDLRKSYTGLAAIIKLKFHLDPYSRCMFAFCNRRRTLIKSRPVLPLYVRILQSQTHIDQDPPVGRFRILDSDETSGPEFLPLAGHTG